MLYLLAVMASALLFGSGPAILAAIASFVAFNFFFIEPRYTFTVADKRVGRPRAAARNRRHHRAARGRPARPRARGRATREGGGRPLRCRPPDAEPDLERALTAVAERLRAELSLAAVVVAVGGEKTVRAQADTGDSEAIALAQEAARLPEMILGTGQAPTASERGRPGRWIRVVPPRHGRWQGRGATGSAACR